MTVQSAKNSLRTKCFKETRNSRSLEILEDYTELIADLLGIEKEARVCDIACELGVSHVSVLKNIKKLVREGYLKRNAVNQIILTNKGKKMAAFAKRKHQILSEFLIKIGVPEHIAAIDVEGIEHYISAQTLKALENFLKNNRGAEY